MSLYPLKFVPRFVEKIWGGRKIETVLGKKLPIGKSVGESWEIYDFPPGLVEHTEDWVSSQIANGPLAGRPLHWVVREFGAQLLGGAQLVGGQFPLLIKFLDAREDLSVQVHPDRQYAATHPNAHLKNEAWYVLENSPGARLFKGLKPGTTRMAFAAAVANGAVEQHLASINAKPGQCHYLPSGTVHALGAGMLVAEVQTPSDTTFRVFDFNRVEPSTGKQRTLHVEQAMQCIDFSAPADAPAAKPPSNQPNVQLVSSPYFKISRVRLRPTPEVPIARPDLAIWIVLEGNAQIKVDGMKDPVRFARGDVMLLPPAMKNPILRTQSDCAWLEVTIPSE